jgi:hypothetical protein
VCVRVRKVVCAEGHVNLRAGYTRASAQRINPSPRGSALLTPPLTPLLTPQGTAAVAAVLSGNHSIYQLSLAGCPMRDEGAAALAEALKANISLYKLDVSNCLVSAWVCAHACVRVCVCVCVCVRRAMQCAVAVRQSC